MYPKNALILLLSIFIFSSSTPLIQDVGDQWKKRVDEAMELIKTTDKVRYDIINENCKKVEFIVANHSTTGDSIIAISKKDMELSSINNIAAVLVHESEHLFLKNHNFKKNEIDEELHCYLIEYDFLSRLPYVEEWLFRNAIDKILYYQNLKAHQKK